MNNFSGNPVPRGVVEVRQLKNVGDFYVRAAEIQNKQPEVAHSLIVALKNNDEQLFREYLAKSQSYITEQECLCLDMKASGLSTGDIEKSIATAKSALEKIKQTANRPEDILPPLDMPVTFKEFQVLPPEIRHNAIQASLSSIVGNEEAVEILSIYLFDALGNSNHVCPHNIALLGPSSAGKTMMARKFAETLEIPYVELNPRAIKSIHSISEEIKSACEKYHIDFVGDPIKLPPMVIFIDEAHALSNGIEQALLKATERSDTTLVTEKGVKLDCSNVCWQLATTERGKLFEPFDTRFEKINLRLYTKDEVAQIISNKFPEWTQEICKNIANYCSRVPRESIAFAEMVKLAYAHNPGEWEEVIARVAELKGIDPYGMTYKRLDILTALGQRPLSIDQLCTVAGCEQEELRKYILPWLKESTPDQKPYVVVTNRHYITDEGLAELDKRGISYKNREEVLSKR
jgi:Holliday junction resolvasome RuvABC ATP-dependent DNA helicase subunit